MPESSILEEIHAAFDRLLEINGVISVVAASKDGFLVASLGVRSLDTEALAAIAAIHGGSVASLANFLDLGAHRLVTLEYGKGVVYLGDIEDHVLIVVAGLGANQAAIRNALQHT